MQKSAQPNTIFSVGYEGQNIEGFIAALQQHAIETLVDVRETPLSRKPGFSKAAFAQRLAAVGIDYVHIRALGCPKVIRDAHRGHRDWPRYCQQFNEYLAAQSHALEKLHALVQQSNCCLLCFEADSQHCHRSLICTELEQRYGTTATHIEPQKTPSLFN